MNSIKPTQIIFITGKFDCLPRANKIPIGKEATIPVTPTISDKVNPPIFNDSTNGKLTGRIVSKIFTNGSEAKEKNKAVTTKEIKAAST